MAEMRVYSQVRVRILFVCLVLVMMFAIGSAAWAQDGGALPITVGDNLTGELTGAAPTDRYTLTLAGPQSITVQVFALSPGLLPAVQVVNAAGVVVFSEAAAPGETSVRLDSLPLGASTYLVDVQSVGDALGQYLISVQLGRPASPPQPLTLGQPVTAAIGGAVAHNAYAFSTSDPEPGQTPETLLLTVRGIGSQGGPVVVLSDAETSETLAVGSRRLGSVRYELLPGAVDYLVDVSAGDADSPVAYSICVGAVSGPSACPETTAVASLPTVTLAVPQPTPTATLFPLPVSGPCVIASATGGGVNVRSGPSTSYNVLTVLTSTVTAPVLGRLPDGSWYLINLNGFTGWIAGSVTRTGGQCGAVPALTLTPTPTLATTPTATPTPTATTAVTATATATATATSTPAPVATLNFSLPAVYGSTALTSGFVPDPFQVGITAGGPADVSYLGGGCTGYATSAPSFSVNYTAGAFPTLRFYFVGSGDTTMIINSPSGSYFCNDDSFGTANPTIDFTSPAAGRYDIWIGSFAPGGSIGGTLYVTENTTNQP